MNSLININNEATRIDLTGDDPDSPKDNELVMTSERSTVVAAQYGAERTPLRGGTEAEPANPFMPRASLSRSPTGCLLNKEVDQPRAMEEAPEGPTAQLDLGSRKECSPVRDQDHILDDCVGITRAALMKLIKQAREATSAVNAIYVYSKTTKNVSRLLKEKSGLALSHLRSIAALAEQTGNDGKVGKTSEGADNLGRNARSIGSQTEEAPLPETRRSETLGDKAGGWCLKSRKGATAAVREKRPGEPRQTTLTGGGDKRKEISPPEPSTAKRSRLNGGSKGTPPQIKGGAAGPKKGSRTRNEEERTPPGHRIPSAKDGTEGEGSLEPSPGPLQLPEKMWFNKSKTQREGRDYAPPAQVRERIPRRALYSEMVGGPGMYLPRVPRGVPRGGSSEIAYLRRARIPHWEWRCYTSEDPTEDEDDEALAFQATQAALSTRAGPLPNPYARVMTSQRPATVKRHGSPKAAPSRRGRRPRRRPKPEAVLVRIQQGGSYAETYRAIVGELRTHLKGLKGVRKTRTGQLLIEIGQDAKVEEVGKLVRNKLGDDAQVRLLQEITTFQLKGLDPIITKEEVAADLAEIAKLEQPEVQVHSLKQMRDGTQVAIVRVPSKKVNGELRAGRLKIGMVICRARILPDITRCFRCHQMGHVGAECQNLEEGKSLCRKCGLEGHRMEDCAKSPRCLLCSRDGLVGSNARHVAGALNCPAYRGKNIAPNNG